MKPAKTFSKVTRKIKLVNPGNLDEVVAEISLTDAELIANCVKKTVSAFSEWASKSFEDRITILSTALDLLEGKSEEVAICITRENGKPVNEARDEVKAALNDGRFQLELVNKTPIRDAPLSLGNGIHGEIWHVPLGVFLLITPWNFPLATVLRKLIPALAWGNAAIVKPALQTPLSPALFFHRLKVAGLPDFTAQLINGNGSDIGNTLVLQPEIKGISFTGSTKVGKGICEKTAGKNVRLQLEMGGKNATVVLNDADLELAVQAVVKAAFTCSGQWCTSTSRVIVEEKIYEQFCQMLNNRVSKLRMGSGLDPHVNFGPVASQSQKDICTQAIKIAKQEGARLICGGGVPDIIQGKRGYFVEPTVFIDVTESMHLFREEVFGPVLGVTLARNVQDALRLVNSSPYGLSFSVFTADQEKANIFLQEVTCGMVHHNLHSAYRHPAFPISGWKDSGQGIPECGAYARDFFTQTKVVYRA